MKNFTRIIAGVVTCMAITAIVVLNPPKSITKPSIVKRNVRDVEDKKEAINALQFMSVGRAYPNAEIPGDAYGKAYANFKKLYANDNNSSNNRSKSIQSGSWTNFGPNNIGGRTLSMAFSPTDTSVIYLGSASGGLWKSTTGGIGVNAWTYIPTGHEVLGVSSIAIHSNNPNEMYIGTGETYSYGTSLNGLIDRTTRGSAGIGILKTTDGGVTWTQSLNWNFQQNRCVWDIVYNPLQQNTLYAATTDGVYKTTDAGATWNLVLAQQMVTNLVIHKTDTATIFAGVGDLNSTNKGLYKSTNSGATWSIVGGGLPTNTQNGRIIVSACASNNDTMMCEVCNDFNTVGIYRSNNKGVTWTSVTPFTEVASWQGWYAKGLLMQPGNHNNVLMGGVELFGSSSFGNNLNQKSNIDNLPIHFLHSDIHGIYANPRDNNKIYILTDGGLFRSNDFGSTFYECTDGYVTSQMYIGSVSASNSNNILAGLQDNYSDAYNGSLYWSGIIGGDGSYNAIDPINDQIQYASYQYFNVYQTTDQWNSSFNYICQSPSSAAGGNPAAFLAPLVISPSNHNILYGGSDTLYVSTDQGMSFNPIGPTPFDNGNAILAIGVANGSSDTVYVGTAPSGTSNPCHIFRTTDGGLSFTDVTGSLPNRYPRRITVNPANSHEVYIAYSGFGAGHLFKSTNDGTTWTDISVPSLNIPFHCLAVDPLIPNHLYAGCDFGVFSSYDDGMTWTNVNSGFPDVVMVFDLVVSPSDRQLLAFTHGHGAYKIGLPSPAGIGNVSNMVLSAEIYPNPACKVVNVMVTSDKMLKTNICIYDRNGKRVLNMEQTIAVGNNMLRLNIENLADGEYFLSLYGGSHRVTKKLVVLN